MATNLPSCFSIQFLEQLLKFLVNFTLLKYVKSQRSCGFLITKELIFGFQILDLKDHFSASLKTMLKLMFSSSILIIVKPVRSNFVVEWPPETKKQLWVWAQGGALVGVQGQSPGKLREFCVLVTLKQHFPEPISGFIIK